MGQDDEFRETERKTIVNRDKQEFADFNNSMAGRETGRRIRFGYENETPRDIARKEKQKRALERALLLSAKYAALYNETLQNLNNAENAVYDAQIKAHEAVNDAEKALQQALEKANTTEGGTAIFQAADGSVYTQDGQLLKGDELDSITWPDDAPSWEEYQKLQRDLQEKQQFYDLMNSHEQRLGELRAEMEDKDNPPTEERLKEMNEEIAEIHNDAAPIQTKEYEVSKIKYDTSEGLDFNF